MAKSLKEAVGDRTNYIKYEQQLLKATVTKSKALGLDKVFAALVGVCPEADMYVGLYTVQVTLPVKSMKHILEALEFITARTGLEFGWSEDSPACSTRTFRVNADHWLSINASVAGNEDDETATCKKVQVGVETKTEERPVYKLVCTD